MENSAEDGTPAATGSRTCPACGLVNPGSATICDCGFDFITGKGRAAQPAIDTRWLRVVKVALVVSMLVPAVLVIAVSGELFPFGLLLAGAFGWYHWWLFSRLRKTRPKKGLAVAIGTGLVIFFYACVGFAIAWVGSETKVWLVPILVGLPSLVPVALVASAIKAYYTMGREPGDSNLLVKGLLRGLLYFFILGLPVAVVVPSLVRSPTAAHQASAVGSLRTINTADIMYESTYDRGYSPTLAALGPPPGNAQASAAAAGLIDSVLASGIKSGYTFSYSPGLADKAGRVKNYTVSARPLKYTKTGWNSYFIDETGVIRQTNEDRAATVKDPPLAG